MRDSLTSGTRDLTSVVAHELGHSLGFGKSPDSSGNYTNGQDIQEYEKNLRDSNSVAAGNAAFVSDDEGVVWAGPIANALHGSPIPIYSPNPYSSGSSLSHPDRPVTLMNRSHSGDPDDNAIRSFDEIEMAMLRDSGWSTITTTSFFGNNVTATETRNLSSSDGTASLIIVGSDSDITTTGTISAQGLSSSGAQVIGNLNTLSLGNDVSATGDAVVGVVIVGTEDNLLLLRGGNTLSNAGDLAVNDITTGPDATNARVYGVLVIDDEDFSLNNNSGASISATGQGATAVKFDNHEVASSELKSTVVNNGLIAANGGSSIAVDAEGELDLTNDGTIQSGGTGSISISTRGISEITSSGAIQSTGNGSTALRSFSNLDLVNDGTIASTGDTAQAIHGRGITTIQNNDSISSTGAGSTALHSESNLDLVNDGTIASTGANVKTIDAEGFTQLRNNGAITATGIGSTAVHSESALYMNNAGTISAQDLGGSATTAITTDNEYSRIAMSTGAIVDGDISYTGSDPSLRAELLFGTSYDDLNAPSIGPAESAFDFTFNDDITGDWDLGFIGGLSRFEAPGSISGIHDMSVEAGATVTGDADITGTNAMTNAGRVVNEGATHSFDTITNNATGRYLGTGNVATVNGFINSGTIAPGDTFDGTNEAKAFGNLNVTAGDFNNNAGTLEIDIDGTGTTQDRIVVTDQAIIDGGVLDVTSTINDATVGAMHTFLTSSALTINSGLTPIDNLVTRRMLLRNDATDYWLLVARDVAYDELGQTFNEDSVGMSLDAIKDDAAGNPLFVPLIDQLDLLPQDSDVRRALNQLTGEIYATSLLLANQNNTLTDQSFADSQRSGLFIDQPLCGGPGGWFGSSSGYGQGGNTTGDGNASTADVTRGGTVVTIGRCFDTATHGGFFYNGDWQSIDVDSVNSVANIETHRFGGFLSRRTGDDYYFLSASGGFNDQEFDRVVRVGEFAERLESQASGSTWGARLERGRLLSTRMLDFIPYLGLQYNGLSRDDLQETGGVASLDVRGDTVQTLRTMLGVSVRTPVTSGPFGLALDTVWMHDVLNQSVLTQNVAFAGSNAGPFDVRGVDVDNDLFRVSPSLYGRFGGVLMQAGYDLTLGENQTWHSGTGTATWIF
ncbi:autotransporter outer membrane beta-barrel domain-containing protein [Rosistilla ulvae]|uniref:autotransporter outer membrane beta-barrel domain-containing protein n=1 Tax=Rosistilla ulvae TaxID=1930277 RepID=UPI001C54F111|nr:autotransporter outer membrane beta-barrel domain-containing protein [Rosistilla ulvae]